MVKNLMRRALDDLIDQPPTEAEQTRLRDHFGNACCYCGAPAPRRSGHIDHAVAGGGNRLSNLVLACATCNGDEKREMGWQEFLNQKCGSDVALLPSRRARIEAWLHSESAHPRHEDPHVRAARAACEQVIEAYGTAYSQLRDAVRKAADRG